MPRRADSRTGSAEPTRSWNTGHLRLLPALLALGLAALLFWALAELAEEPSPGLAAQVEQRIDQSGVTHPVTAVLMNFRGYDTWLKLGVLLVAVMGALALQRSDDVSHVPALRGWEDRLSGLVRLLVPWMVLISGYLLWSGSHVSAGAVLAAAGVLMGLGGVGQPLLAMRGISLRAGATVGVGVFTLVAVGVMFTGRALLEYPVAWAGVLIFAIELAAMISIALALVMLFIAAHPVLSGADEMPSRGE